ncbi:ligase-associated DNA damage response endonuclease PdeM [Maioricimonas sp. JC845]|uniref:ligase-associated DNA damage response endonuclease PdeM n=1 Tax=Maioricimonas sp. JC845 TaxID=3232138 RepID=UPI003457CCBD
MSRVQQGWAQVELGGETLTMLPERALAHRATESLFVADLHWGKSGTFRAASLPIPGGTLQDDLRRLSDTVAKTRSRRLVVLGDLLHSSRGIDPTTREEIDAWRAGQRHVEILLVRGNHDRHVDWLADWWGIRIVEAPQRDGPFELRHEPDGSGSMPALAGHIHPRVRLRGPGGERLGLPCFWLQKNQLVLPAFSSFVDGANIGPGPGDRVWAIAGDEVIECRR